MIKRLLTKSGQAEQENTFMYLASSHFAGTSQPHQAEHFSTHPAPSPNPVNKVTYFHPRKTTVTCPECATTVCTELFPLMAPMRGERYESPS